MNNQFSLNHVNTLLIHIHELLCPVKVRAEKRRSNGLMQIRKEGRARGGGGKKVRCSPGECILTNDRVVARSHLPKPQNNRWGIQYFDMSHPQP